MNYSGSWPWLPGGCPEDPCLGLLGPTSYSSKVHKCCGKKAGFRSPKTQFQTLIRGKPLTFSGPHF